MKDVFSPLHGFGPNVSVFQMGQLRPKNPGKCVIRFAGKSDNLKKSRRNSLRSTTNDLDIFRKKCP